eukprot:1370084-Rhodomonas_salina.1
MRPLRDVRHAASISCYAFAGTGTTYATTRLPAMSGTELAAGTVNKITTGNAFKGHDNTFVLRMTPKPRSAQD